MVQDEAIREALKQYTVSGALGHLLDAERDGLALADFTVFELEELMGLGDKYALPTLLYLFRRIGRSLQGQPSAIIVDEAWLLLGHPVIRRQDPGMVESPAQGQLSGAARDPEPHRRG